MDTLLQDFKEKLRIAQEHDSTLAGIDLVCSLAKYIYGFPANEPLQEPCNQKCHENWISLRAFLKKYSVFDDSTLQRYCNTSFHDKGLSKKKDKKWFVKEKETYDYLMTNGYYRKPHNSNAFKNCVNYN